MKTKTQKLLRKNSPCPKCGGTMEFDAGFDGSYFEPSLEAQFVCIDCEHEPDTTEVDWHNFYKPALSEEQEKQIEKILNEVYKLRSWLYDPANREPVKVEDLFYGCPDGDFHYEGEPEDVGNVWTNDEGEWRQDCQYLDTGRENGKVWFVVYHDSIAGCADYQPVGGWDEREGDTLSESILSALWFDLEGRSIDHFAGWAEYFIDCAKTGEDPLKNFYGEFTAQKAIDAAKDNLGYLRKMKKRIQKGGAK